MKLLVITALVAVAAAGRLEHLERAYLPPFGSNGLGSQGSQGSFGGNSGGFGAAGAGLHGHNAGGNFAGATSNQYLPPDHGPSGSNSAPLFAGSLKGFGGQQNFRSQQYSSHQAAPALQYGAPGSQFGSHGASGSQFGSHGASGSQFGSHGASGSQFGSHGASGSRGAPSSQFGSHGASGSRGAPSSQFGSHGASGAPGARSYQQFGQQSAAASRQYLAPHTGSYQQPPQQAFDEQTGYHY